MQAFHFALIINVNYNLHVISRRCWSLFNSSILLQLLQQEDNGFVIRVDFQARANLPTRLPARLETTLSGGAGIEITFISVHTLCQTVANLSRDIMFTKENNFCISALDCVANMNIIITEPFTE